MTDWINGVCDEVDRIAAQDTYYQELDAQRMALEPAYLNILHSSIKNPPLSRRIFYW